MHFFDGIVAFVCDHPLECSNILQRSFQLGDKCLRLYRKIISQGSKHWQPPFLQGCFELFSVEIDGNLSEKPVLGT